MNQANMPPLPNKPVAEESGADPCFLANEAKTPSATAQPAKNRKNLTNKSIGEVTTTLLPTKEGADDEVSGSPEDEEPWGNDLVGKRLSQYRIESLLGRGSMARVFKATHLGLDRICALKILNPRLVSSHRVNRDQFWAEARAAANLIHPHVVTIHNLGSDQGYDFIEMEYVAGAVSLRDCLIHRGPLHPVRAARLVRQVALALHEAHRSGLIHRDVKPANVLLTSSGHAKLADFGLAQRLVGLASRRLAGTPSFMAPELFKGAPASPQSDLYAVGVMLYYLVSGLLPFSAASIKALIQLHHTHPVPDLRADGRPIPEGLMRIIRAVPGQDPLKPVRLMPESWPTSSGWRFIACATPRVWSRKACAGLTASCRAPGKAFGFCFRNSMASGFRKCSSRSTTARTTSGSSPSSRSVVPPSPLTTPAPWR